VHASANTIVGSSDLISGRATASVRKGDADLLVSAAALSFAGNRRYLCPADADGNQAVVLNGDGESEADIHAAGVVLDGHVHELAQAGTRIVALQQEAERTTAATKEIAGTIQSVQEETATAVAQMEAGTQLVEQGVADTSKAGSALRQIIDAAEQVGDKVAQIATAANEQTSAMAEINRSVEHISEITQRSEATAEESSATCKELQSLAADLEHLVSRFKLEAEVRHLKNAA